MNMQAITVVSFCMGEGSPSYYCYSTYRERGVCPDSFECEKEKKCVIKLRVFREAKKIILSAVVLTNKCCCFKLFWKKEIFHVVKSSGILIRSQQLQSQYCSLFVRFPEQDEPSSSLFPPFHAQSLLLRSIQPQIFSCWKDSRSMLSPPIKYYKQKDLLLLRLKK